MQFNRKTTTALVAIGVLIGGAAVVSWQVRAQQITTPQTQTANTVASDKVTPADTDNIQDPGNVEVPDVKLDTTVNAKDTDLETNDDKGQTVKSQTTENENDGTSDSASDK